ncbi:MAG: hypothetical protein H0X41_00640 [Chitinophagaceae bacterium]|nr:hypothetical protein [Chitinophagaceae bacterium]
MIRKQQIEKEIEAAIASLDHLAPASPAPFFYTRLSARMMKEEKNVWGRVSRTITRPVIAGLSVALIIAVNIFAVLHHTPKTSAGVPDQAEIAVADEYNRSTSLYNIDNVQP